SGNIFPAGALVLDGNPSLVNYGSPDPNSKYSNNRYAISSMGSRAGSVDGGAGGAGGAFPVRGYDVYAYPMAETITATAGATTVAGKKAFKFVTSVIPAFTDAHNYSFGTTDVFGLPLRASN